MIRRILAYIFDLFAISIIVGALSSSPLNPKREKMFELQDEYMEKVEEFQEIFQEGTDEEKVELDITGFLDYYQDYMYEYGKVSVYEEVITLLCMVLYFTVFAYYFGGQTVGKRLLKIKVVDKDGEKVKMSWLFLRTIILFGIPFSIVAQILIFTLSRQQFIEAYSILNAITIILNVIIIGLMFFRDDRRGLHDLLSKTKVIREEN